MHGREFRVAMNVENDLHALYAVNEHGCRWMTSGSFLAGSSEHVINKGKHAFQVSVACDCSFGFNIAGSDVRSTVGTSSREGEIFPIRMEAKEIIVNCRNGEWIQV